MTDYRHEYKYRLTAAQAALLERRAAGILRRDPHAGSVGSYCIRSLYFDTPEDACFYENEDGIGQRSKFRIRYYGTDTGFLRLEKKTKYRGMTRKEACPITLEQCRQFMAGKVPPITKDLPPKARELFLEMRLRHLVPKVIVLYERVPFVDPVGNVRITFDRGLMSSNDISRFLEENVTRRPVFRQGESLMEVKWDELLPSHIAGHMTLESLQWTSFSKYYLCRKYNCYGGIRV